MGHDPSKPKDRCCDGDTCGPQVDRRDFVKTIGLGIGGLLARRRHVRRGTGGAARGRGPARPGRSGVAVAAGLRRRSPGPHRDADWRHRHGHGLARRPGRPARLGDHEPPGQGVRSAPWQSGDGRAVSRAVRSEDGQPAVCRLLEGPSPISEYEGSHGARTPNEHLPRFRSCPLRDGLSVRPGDAVRSRCAARRRAEGLQSAGARRMPTPAASRIAVFTVSLRNRRARRGHGVAPAMSLPNFIGVDGATTATDWKGDSRAGRSAAQSQHGQERRTTSAAS